IGLGALLFFTCVFKYSQRPPQSFWSYAPNWNYMAEYRVYQIVKNEHLTNYNIANLTYYDTYSSVVKYLLKRDNIQIQYDDYYTNTYLFVIAPTLEMKNAPYEVATFKPATLLKTWKINDGYNLYLLQRESKS
ncbi:hypothetical protein HGB07_00615, partial [Candidatus Roizmanbacteria bacterium]|nr:hypothetical protein [Candidatus Roizmanbacteria bacterium]